MHIDQTKIIYCIYCTWVIQGVVKKYFFKKQFSSQLNASIIYLNKKITIKKYFDYYNILFLVIDFKKNTEINEKFMDFLNCMLNKLNIVSNLNQLIRLIAVLFL